MMSYLAAIVMFVCLEQPLSSLETLTYRKQTTPATKIAVSEKQDVVGNGNHTEDGVVVVNKNVGKENGI